MFNGTTTSGPLIVDVQSVAPSFLLFSPKGYVVAVHANSSLVGPASLYPGLSTPAQPGEPIVVYGVGFGLTSTPVTEGSASQSGVLPSPVVCRIGGAEAVAFAGLISPGLYQFNITVPGAAASGDNTIVCAYGGATTPPGNLITIQR